MSQHAAASFSVPCLGAYRRFVARLVATGLLGKDVARFLWLAVGLSAVPALMISLAIVAASAEKTGRLGFPVPPPETLSIGSTLYLMMVLFCAVLIGLAQGADEIESRTGSLLRSLPLTGWAFIKQKLGAGAVLVGLAMLISALLLGAVCRNPFYIFELLLCSHPTLFFSERSQVGGLPVLLLQLASLHATALAAMLCLRHLFKAAVAIAVLHAILQPALSHVQSLSSRASLEIMESSIVVAMLLLVTLAGLLVAKRSFDSIAARGADSVGAGTDGSTPLFRLRLSMPGHLRARTLPERRFLIAAMWFGMPSMLLATVVMPPSFTTANWMFGVSTPIYFLLGVSAWSAQECSSSHGLMYHMPVSRWRLVMSRVAAALASAAVLWLIQATIVALRFTGVRYDVPGSMLPLIRTLAAWTFVMAVSFVLLGMMFRLLASGIIVALTAAVAVAVVWSFGSTINLGNHLRYAGASFVVGPDAEADRIGPFLAYVAWAALWSWGIPIGVMLLSAACTPLLELRARKRDYLMVAVALIVAVWGGIALTAFPSDLMAMVFG